MQTNTLPISIDQVQDYLVCIQGGSGCLFQPIDASYSYILTAKHVLFDSDKNLYGGPIDIRRYCGTADSKVEQQIPLNALVPGTNFFPHPKKDIAILKIDKIEGLSGLIRTDDLLSDRQNYILAGYPDVRRSKKVNRALWYRNNEGVVIKERKEEFREAKVEGAMDWKEVRGQSGGGILKLQGSHLLLAGIQNRMVPGQEQLGNIEFSPMSSFDEIVDHYKPDLAPLYAPFLHCFSYLREYIFKLQAGFHTEDIAFAVNYLKDKTRAIVQSDTTPYFIKEFFSTKLLVHRQPPEVLQTRNIWIAWLEFLIILNLVKDKVHTREELSGVFNSFRLLFSNTTGDWSEELQNLIYSDYTGLRSKGLVVIGTPNPPHNEGYELPNDIPLITRAKNASDRSQLKIDNGISFPFESFRFVHLDYFKNRSISKKYHEFATIQTDAELLAKLKQEYAQLFEHND